MTDRRRRVSSSSRSGGAVHELTHDWTITGYDFIKGYQIERFNSPPFKFYGFEWFIQFYPHGTTDNRENVAIFLIGKDLPKAEILCSNIQFAVLNQSDDAKTLRPRPYYYVLSGKDTKHNHSNSGGHINVIKSADLHDSTRGFIGDDGTLRIRLELKVSCLDPTLCPHARDPRTGECRLSAAPDTSTMEVHDDSPATRAGLMPSLRSLLLNEVCADVELRVATSPDDGLDDDSRPSNARRFAFEPFDTSNIPHAPCTPRAKHQAPKHDGASSLWKARTHNGSFNDPSPAHSHRTLNPSAVSLDTTLDEDEFLERLETTQHAVHPPSTGDSYAAQHRNSSVALSSPPRCHSSNGASFAPQTPSVATTMAAVHAGPTTPAPEVEPQLFRHQARKSQRQRTLSPKRAEQASQPSKPSNMEHYHSRSAHKCILASRSPVFRAMFSLRMQESVSNVVEIRDMRPEVLDALLAYIYSDKEPDLQLAPEMLVVADKYQMAGLLHTCECVLARSLTAENCVAALVFAERYAFRCPHLRETTMNFVCDHFAATVCRSAAFINLMRTHTALAHEVVCEQARYATMVGVGGSRHSP